MTTLEGSAAPTDPAAPALEPVETPSQAFLQLVCYTDTALQNLSASALAAGGWGDLSRQEARRQAEAAIKSAREVARQIPLKAWPDSIAAQMPEVAEEYLSLVQPLQRIASSTSGGDRSAAWRELKAQQRTAEEQVRLTLKLGYVDAPNDGCPPPPAIKPARPDAPGTATRTGWTQHWTSPSGNIKCGYNPAGSRGVPVVACLVSDENWFMKLTQGVGVEGPLTAASDDVAQLTSSGATKLGYGLSRSAGPFMCQQSSIDGVGMSCWDPGTGQGFSVKRGTYEVYP